MTGFCLGISYFIDFEGIMALYVCEQIKKGSKFDDKTVMNGSFILKNSRMNFILS